MRKLRSERGAAAVEFAIVLPVLMAILFGVIEYGRVFFIQNSITNAARVGARTMVIESAAGLAGAAGDAQAKAAAAAAVSPVGTAVTACSTGGVTTMTVTYSLTALSGFLPVPAQLTGKAQMRCES
jgi:Flp pilus assembly protein TadG